MKAILDSGRVIDIGATKATPTIGITDYSRRVTDDFGVTTVVERGFSRTMSVQVAVLFDRVDELQRTLAGLRATPAQWVADDRFASLSIRGFYKEFSIDVATASLSFCTLSVEGLAGTDVVADAGGDPAPEALRSTLQLLRPIAVGSAQLVASNVPEADASEWATGKAYPSGARVIKAATHRIYESLAAVPAGDDPVAASGKWLDVGPTNRWAMFDQALGSVTTANGSIAVAVDVGAIDAVAVLDVVGATVRVQATDYDRTVPIIGGSISLLDLPNKAGRVTVTITGNGTVSAGTLLVGHRVALGLTEAAPTAGITDYSRKVVDDFGEVTVVERAWAKRMTANALIRTDAVDAVANRIAAVRAQPVLWIGRVGTDSLTIYGFFKDFSIEIGKAVSKLSLSIEGLSTAGKIEPLGSLVEWPDIADPTGTKPTNNADKTSENTSKDTAAVGGRPAGTVIETIDKARQDIDGLIETVSEGQTDLSEQVNAANAARDASQTARDQSQAARDAAQAASTLSGAAKDAAQTAKTAAESAATTATQKATDAGGYASTATGQATIATQKADAAGQSASSASANATTASTKAGDASMSAQSAVTAKNDAQGSATAAGTSAGVASQAKTDALAAAKASSDSASSASTSSSAAGQSATAAAGSATAANTSAGAASTSAGQASTSASNAQGSANSAATNSALAASAGAQATSSAALLMPSDFSQNGTFFMTNYLGTWESAKPESSGWSFPVPSTKVARSPLWAGGTGSEHPSRQFTTRGRIQLQPNRRYRFTLRCGLNRYSGSGAVNINLFWIATTADGVTHASSYNAGLWQIPAPGQIYTKVWEIGSNDVIAATYDNRFSVSPFIRCFGDDGNQLDIYDFKFEDITESSNAAGSASAANTSASSAAASRDAAGSSASAANQSKLDAQTAQGQASSSATNAATSASNAAGSSNAAATSATLSAQSATQAGVLGSGNLVRKPSFEDGTVKGWENWFNPSYGKDGSLYFARTASLDTLIYNPTPGNGIKREWGGRVLRIRALMNTLETDGSFGAGLFLEYRNGSRGYPAQYLGARKSWTWIEYNYTVPADVIAINPWCQLTVQGNGSAGLISYFEITDITESSTAAGSASAAVNSASAAKTSQDGAGASAVAANQSRIDAQAANGAAQGAASAASSSAASANSSASQAQTSASLSASYVSSMVPADFSQGGAMWMTQYYGTWNDYKPEAWGWSFPQVSSSTVAARSPRWVGGDGSTHPSRQWTTRGRLRLTPGKRYRLTFRGGLVTYNGQGIIGFDMDWLAWDADGVTHRGATSAGYTAFPAANALYQWVFELDAQTLINDSSAKSGGYYGGFVSPLIRGRGADGQQLDIWDFKFEDITAESKADTNAARIEAVNRTLADQYGALAQRVSNTEATAGNLASRTGITETAVADLRTKQAAARIELTAGSGGGNATATIRSDTINGTAIDFGADNINFVGNVKVQKNVGGNVISIDSDHGFIITAPNGVRVIELTVD